MKRLFFGFIPAVVFLAGCGSRSVCGGGLGLSPALATKDIMEALPAAGETREGNPFLAYAYSESMYFGLRYSLFNPTDDALWDDGQGFTFYWRGAFPTSGVGTHIWDVGWTYGRYYPDIGDEECEFRMVFFSVAKTFFKNSPVYLGGGLGYALIKHPTLGATAGTSAQCFVGTQILMGNIDISLEGGYLAANPSNVKLDAVFMRVAVLFAY